MPSGVNEKGAAWYGDVCIVVAAIGGCETAIWCRSWLPTVVEATPPNCGNWPAVVSPMAHYFLLNVKSPTTI